MTRKKIRGIVGEINVKDDGFMHLGKGSFTASDLEIIKKKNVTSKRIRANVINNALWVEDFLDDIIERVMFPGNKKLFLKNVYTTI